MSLLSKEDRELSKRASGFSDTTGGPWKKQPTMINTPSNDKPEMPRQRGQTPYGRSRFASNVHGHSGKSASMPVVGNPNRRGAVFDTTPSGSKRRKVQEMSSSRRPGPSGLSKQEPLDKPIDLTKEDAELVSYSSTVADDSEDSLNLGAEERSGPRVVGDGRATRRLKADRRGGESSKAVNSDTETEVIGEFPAQTRGEGRVRSMARRLESSGGKSGKPTPKLPLELSNPFNSLPLEKHKPKAKYNNASITGPTAFIHGQKSKKAVTGLPLTDWVRGTERLTESREHFLSWAMERNEPIFKVTSAKGQRGFRVNVKREAQNLEASTSSALPLIIKFGLRQNHPPLRPGSNGSYDMMAFRVDTEDEACNPVTRRSLYDFLRDKCECKGWLPTSGAASAWDAVVGGLSPPLTLQPKERKSPLPIIPNAVHGRERHSSVSSHPELPSSIKLSPPPGGEVPLSPKALQKVKQMNPKQTTEEQRDTREVVKDEAIAGPSNQPLRRSFRQATLHSSFSTVDPVHTSPSEDPDELLLVYRPLGTGAVNITRGDLERLQPGKYLNDTLIEFGLKLWLNGLRDRDPELADQIHLFSSFFYKKLAIRDKKAGYESVRKWTSRVDVFNKKYLVVPINEHLHWYLAIIYQPGYTLRPSQPPDSPLTRKRKRDEELSADSTIEVSESRETPTTTSKPTSKATTETPEGGEVEIIPDSEPSSPKMEVEEQTQTDETTKPEEQEVETQLCAEVSSVSLDEHEQEGPGSRNGEPNGTVYVSRVEVECMEIDDSPPSSPMRIDREVHIEDLTGESTPHGTVEPSIVGTEDMVPEAPPIEMKDSFGAGTVDVQTFYGTAAAVPRTDSKKPRVSAPAELEGGFRRDLDDIKMPPLKMDKTYIFVFDSLNGKHPGAMRNLAQYLQFEATDKKKLENPSPPETMTAYVPNQDNYCDCGLYLLHFAKVFMEDPAKPLHTILAKAKGKAKGKGPPKADRDVEWKKELVGTSREDLTRRILELSEVWVKERAKEAEEKAKAKEKEGTSKPESIAVDSPEDSDDDVILEEVVAPKPDLPKNQTAKRPVPTKKGAAARSKGGTNSKTEVGPAEPERTAAERIR